MWPPSTVLLAVLLILSPFSTNGACQDRTMQQGTFGSGGIDYLDRSPVTCPQNTMLNGFQLQIGSYVQRLNDTNHPDAVTPVDHPDTPDWIEYKATCCDLPTVSDHPIVSGGGSYVSSCGSAKLDYLDRHDIRCSEGSVLSSFAMHGPCKDGIHYTWQCLDLPLVQCESRTTPGSSFGSGKIDYLDRQHVACNSGELLTEFHLNAVSDESLAPAAINYNYKCCMPKCEQALQISGSWTQVQYSSGNQTIEYDVGTHHNYENSRTSQWSEAVTVKVKQGWKIGAGEGSVEVDSETSWGVAQTYSEQWGTSTTTKKTFQLGEGMVWEWKFTSFDSCGYSITGGDYIVTTPSAAEPPCCLPGYAKEPSKQHGDCNPGSNGHTYIVPGQGCPTQQR